jgi:hypothetical protein
MKLVSYKEQTNTLSGQNVEFYYVNGCTDTIGLHSVNSFPNSKWPQRKRSFILALCLNYAVRKIQRETGGSGIDEAHQLLVCADNIN